MTSVSQENFDNNKLTNEQKSADSMSTPCLDNVPVHVTANSTGTSTVTFTSTSITTTTENVLVPSSNIQKQSQRRIFKIIVIGDSNVGKTCLTYRFCSGKFPDRTEATIGVDFRERTTEIGGDVVKLQLWDTAGQERFRKSMVQHYYRNVHAVVFVYDVTKVSSFEGLPSWISECDQHHLSANIPRILVGNKCDMVDRVAVATNRAQKFADSHSMPLFETSAKDDEKANHVESIFMTLAHKLQQSRPMMLSRLSSSDSQSSSVAPVITIGQHHTGHGLEPGPPGGKQRSDKSCSC